MILPYKSHVIGGLEHSSSLNIIASKAGIKGGLFLSIHFFLHFSKKVLILSPCKTGIKGGLLLSIHFFLHFD